MMIGKIGEEEKIFKDCYKNKPERKGNKCKGKGTRKKSGKYTKVT